MKSIVNIIKSDLYRYDALSGIKGFLKGFVLIPGFRYTYFLRRASKYKRYSLLGVYYHLLLNHYSFKYGFQIPAGTKIGPGFYLGHFGTVVINVKVKIGNNCNIGPNVIIGQTNRGIRKGTPQIGNMVWIGTSAVIVGGITIGSNVLIAPLSYVNIDVPDNSLVIGNPAKIIPKEDATEGYINFTIE